MTDYRHGDDSRFWSRVVVTDRQECWEWTGNHDKYGYGREGVRDIVERYGTNLVHRISFLSSGRIIPRGWTLDHLDCRNPGCSNPWHLAAVPLEINNSRSRSMAGQINGDRLRSQTHCKHGHEFTPENTYVYPNGYRQCRRCVKLHRRGR